MFHAGLRTLSGDLPSLSTNRAGCRVCHAWALIHVRRHAGSGTPFCEKCLGHSGPPEALVCMVFLAGPDGFQRCGHVRDRAGLVNGRRKETSPRFTWGVLTHRQVFRMPTPARHGVLNAPRMDQTNCHRMPCGKRSSNIPLGEFEVRVGLAGLRSIPVPGPLACRRSGLFGRTSTRHQWMVKREVDSARMRSFATVVFV